MNRFRDVNITFGYLFAPKNHQLNQALTPQEPYRFYSGG